ncbi:MAG: hypothetical protein HY040_06240 [Planctomycetes bacterium]|nr:hypothetical protein [Planctomycetota bacterium]
MRKLHAFGIGVLVLAFCVHTGCSNRPQKSSQGGDKGATKNGKDEPHEHGDGPHGGTLADWGGGKYHVEFCMDHGKKQATVYIFDNNVKKPVPIKADKLLLSIKKPSFQLELKPMPQEGDPKGSASRFVGTHDNFATEQEFAGTISGQVDGTPYVGDFEEKPETPKKK